MASRARSDFRPTGFFALRTPLLPIETLDRLGEDRDALRALVRRPEIREALFLASPGLSARLEEWLADPARRADVEKPLLKYLVRMASRSTPFGLFAACSLGTIGDQTHLTFDASSADGDREARWARNTRLDVHYLDALVSHVTTSSDARTALGFVPNSSLYRLPHGDLRFAEVSVDDSGRNYVVISVEPSDYLDAVLERAKGGARLDELARVLVDRDAEISFEEALEYVGELVASQLLVPTLAVPLTGRPPTPCLVEELRAVGEHAAADGLARCERALRELDDRGLGQDPSGYDAIAKDLATLGAPVDRSRLFQVDLFRSAHDLCLGPDAIALVEAAGAALRRIGRPKHAALEAFKKRFHERYEGREVPLLEALDDDAGVGALVMGGAPVPLLEGLDILGPARADAPKWTPRDDALLVLLSRALHRGADEIDLDEETLVALGAGQDHPPADAVAVIGSFFRPQEGALGFVVDVVSAASGAGILGRFAGVDAAMEAAVREHLRCEERLRPDAVFAEIVHLPEGRTGNVLLRPLLRDHEIAYLGRSGAPPEKQITLEDLRISIQRDRVVLRSARLDREVVPRLTTAHNYEERGFGPYRFLATLREQDGADLAWSWGRLGGATFLPRVRCGRVVLSRARWRLGAADRNGLDEARFQALRNELRLPRHVGLADRDQVFFADLDNPKMVASLLASFKPGTEDAVLVEMLPGVDESLVKGPAGSYAHEVIVPFVRAAPLDAAPRVPTARVQDANPRRRFPPGSEWASLYLFTGTATADDVLKQSVGPLVQAALEAGHIDRWFFVRYFDPSHHLRVRLHGAPEVLVEKVWPALAELGASVIEDGLVWRVTFETYEREVERYGGHDGALLFEDLFWADSEASLEMSASLSGADGMEARWRLAFLGFDATLSAFGFDLATKRAVVRGTSAGFDEEYRARAGVERELGVRYRAMRKELDALFSRDPSALAALAPGVEALARRDARSRRVCDALRTLEQEARLTRPLETIARSLIHMNANRLLRVAQVGQEHLLYDWLARTYESRIARDG